MTTTEKVRSKALPLALLCGIVSVLLFFSAVGSGVRMARAAHMQRGQGAAHAQMYRSGPQGRNGKQAGHRGGHGGRRPMMRGGPARVGQQAQQPQQPAPRP